MVCSCIVFSFMKNERRLKKKFVMSCVEAVECDGEEKRRHGMIAGGLLR